MSKILQGKLTISRMTSNFNNPRPIRITLKDDLSSCEVVEINLSLEAFANAITAAGFQPCEFEFNASGVVGKKREHKTEVVFIPNKIGYKKGNNGDRKAVQPYLAPYEVDGWKGRASDALNSHNWDREQRSPPKGAKVDSGNWTTIVFERWVDVPETEEPTS